MNVCTLRLPLSWSNFIRTPMRAGEPIEDEKDDDQLQQWAQEIPTLCPDGPHDHARIIQRVRSVWID